MRNPTAVAAAKGRDEVSIGVEWVPLPIPDPWRARVDCGVIGNGATAEEAMQAGKRWAKRLGFMKDKTDDEI